MVTRRYSTRNAFFPARTSVAAYATPHHTPAASRHGRLRHTRWARKRPAGRRWRTFVWFTPSPFVRARLYRAFHAPACLYLPHRLPSTAPHWINTTPPFATRTHHGCTRTHTHTHTFPTPPPSSPPTALFTTAVFLLVPGSHWLAIQMFAVCARCTAHFRWSHAMSPLFLRPAPRILTTFLLPGLVPTLRARDSCRLAHFALLTPPHTHYLRRLL